MTAGNPPVRLRRLVMAAAVLFTLALLSRTYTTVTYVVVCGVVSFLLIPLIKYEVIPFIRLLAQNAALVFLLSALLLILLSNYSDDTVFVTLPSDGGGGASTGRSPTYLYCQKYSLHLSFDPPNNTFKGTQNILLHGELPLYTADTREAVNKPGVSAIRRGEVLKYEALKSAGERDMVAYLLLSAGMDGWKVEDIDTAVRQEMEDALTAPSIPRVTTVEVRALLSTDQARVSTNREGLITYVSEVGIPSVVVEDQLLSDPKVEIVVTAPQNTYINHNLNGTFSETVLENNKPGQKLIADKVVDRASVVRFNYPSYVFQNRVLSNLISFSWWWAALLAVLSALTGVMGYFCAVVLDVFADDTLKPMARGVLRFFKLIPKAG